MLFDVSVLLILFARVLGFFLLSPLLSLIPFPPLARFGLTVAVTCLLAPLFAEVQSFSLSSGLFLLTLLKEFFLGYLLGLILSLLLESAALAGQLIGTLSGFSATELLNPSATVSHPLWSKLFTLFVASLLFTLDLHHEILKILFNSFSIFPMQSPLLQEKVIQTITETFTYFFHAAFQFAALPLLFLSLLLIIFALAAKMLPEFPIFWLGFPFQIIVGIGTLAIAITFFSDTLQNTFFHLRHLIERIFFDLAHAL